jgi:[acyl-carrier-protein] S-malonyltransferase
MAAIVGMEDEIVEQACNETEGIVVACNYKLSGQLVISGSVEAVNAAVSF